MKKLQPVAVEDLKRTATPTPTVGELRQQTAFQDASAPVVLVTGDPELRALLDTLRVVQVYPDTWSSGGEWKGCFKVEIVRR